MRCPHLDTNAAECHVQERHTADTTTIMDPFFPPFLASTPVIFSKLDGDSICLWASLRRNPMSLSFNASDKGCILICYSLIIDDYHYGSTLIVSCLMLSYIFSDRYIVTSTRFYACSRVVLCVCRYPNTEIVGIVTGQSKGTKATSLRRTLALESK